MILNATAVLALLFALLEIAAGGVLLAAAGRGLRAALRPPGSVRSWEPFRHLLLLLVLLLAILSAASLLAWLLLLQSYVPQWAGLRCVVGVLRIGTGSAGAAGWLPALARGTTILRGALLFGAGAGVVLHLAGRGRPEGPLPAGHLAVLGAVGALAIAGAAAEAAYIVIPKAERRLAAGCCTVPAAIAAGEAAEAPRPVAPWTEAALYALPALALSVLLAAAPRWRRGEGVAGDVLRVAGSGLVLLEGARFVSDVVAPARLGLPLHPCVYCLAAEAPETLVGLALLALPAFASGWRAVARPGGGGGFREGIGGTLDRLALFGLIGGLLLFAGEWLVS